MLRHLRAQWRQNECDCVSNHRRLDCLFNCLFRCRSKKTPKLRVTCLREAIHRWPMDSPHKWPVTRKMFPFDDVIMQISLGDQIRCNIYKANNVSYYQIRKNGGIADLQIMVHQNVTVQILGTAIARNNWYICKTNVEARRASHASGIFIHPNFRT